MTQTSVTTYKWVCDALRCDEETTEGTDSNLPQGWASFTIHGTDWNSHKRLHFCPACVIDLLEVKPIK